MMHLREEYERLKARYREEYGKEPPVPDEATARKLARLDNRLRLLRLLGWAPITAAILVLLVLLPWSIRPKDDDVEERLSVITSEMKKMATRQEESTAEIERLKVLLSKSGTLNQAGKSP